MSNCCYGCYKLVGARVGEVMDVLRGLNVDENWVSVRDFLKSCSVDNEAYSMWLRGRIMWASVDGDVLTMGVESAWAGVHTAIEFVAKNLYGLGVAWREEDITNGLVERHDSYGFFPGNYMISASSGAPFHLESEVTYVQDLESVAKIWCRGVGIDRDGVNEDELPELIERWEYEDDDTFFNVYAVIDV